MIVQSQESGLTRSWLIINSEKPDPGFQAWPAQQLFVHILSERNSISGNQADVWQYFNSIFEVNRCCAFHWTDIHNRCWVRIQYQYIEILYSTRWKPHEVDFCKGPTPVSNELPYFVVGSNKKPAQVAALWSIGHPRVAFSILMVKQLQYLPNNYVVVYSLFMDINIATYWLWIAESCFVVNGL